MPASIIYQILFWVIALGRLSISHQISFSIDIHLALNAFIPLTSKKPHYYSILVYLTLHTPQSPPGMMSVWVVSPCDSWTGSNGA